MSYISLMTAAYLFGSVVIVAVILRGFFTSIMGQSKRHLELQHEALTWRIKANAMQMECVRLQKLVNRKQVVSSQFTNDEIKTLIRLCHPDRHANSLASTAMTKRLLELRK